MLEEPVDDERVLELDVAPDRELVPELRLLVVRLLRRLPSLLLAPVFVFVRCVRFCFDPVFVRDEPLLVLPLEFPLDAVAELVSSASVSVSAQISGEGMPLVRFAT